MSEKSRSNQREDTAGKGAGVSSPDTTRSITRRRLFKAIAAAGAVVSLPARWTRPVVDAVILPAHAQASCLTLTLSGVTNNCEDRFNTTLRNFYVDDTGACPVVVEGQAPTSQQLSTGLRANGLIEARFIVAGDNDPSIVSDCDLPDTEYNQPDLQLPFLASSGASWVATYTRIRTSDGTVSVSDIVLTPV